MNRNPVFEKEIKRNTRSIRISLIVFGCNLLLGGIALICFFWRKQCAGIYDVAQLYNADAVLYDDGLSAVFSFSC